MDGILIEIRKATVYVFEMILIQTFAGCAVSFYRDFVLPEFKRNKGTARTLISTSFVQANFNFVLQRLLKISTTCLGHSVIVFYWPKGLISERYVYIYCIYVTS